MSVSRRDIIDRVARRTGCTRKDATIIVDEVLNIITGAMKHGEDVAIRDFGKFSVIKRPARAAVNPASGAGIMVPARSSIRFKVSRTLRAEVSEALA